MNFQNATILCELGVKMKVILTKKRLCLDHTAPEMLALNVLYSSQAKGGCSCWQMLSNGHHGWRLGLCQRTQRCTLGETKCPRLIGR